jgi:hypothetical protein
MLITKDNLELGRLEQLLNSPNLSSADIRRINRLIRLIKEAESE